MHNSLVLMLIYLGLAEEHVLSRSFLKINYIPKIINLLQEKST